MRLHLRQRKGRRHSHKYDHHDGPGSGSRTAGRHSRGRVPWRPVERCSRTAPRRVLAESGTARCLSRPRSATRPGPVGGHTLTVVAEPASPAPRPDPRVLHCLVGFADRGKQAVAVCRQLGAIGRNQLQPVAPARPAPGRVPPLRQGLVGAPERRRSSAQPSSPPATARETSTPPKVPVQVTLDSGPTSATIHPRRGAIGTRPRSPRRVHGERFSGRHDGVHRSASRRRDADGLPRVPRQAGTDQRRHRHGCDGRSRPTARPSRPTGGGPWSRSPTRSRCCASSCAARDHCSHGPRRSPRCCAQPRSAIPRYAVPTSCATACAGSGGTRCA